MRSLGGIRESLGAPSVAVGWPLGSILKFWVSDSREFGSEVHASIDAEKEKSKVL